jgi:hypothetical protein
MAIDLNKNKNELKYYYSENGATLGPFSLPQLLEKIEADTLVYREGIDWTNAKDVEELRKFFRAPEDVSNHQSTENQKKKRTYFIGKAKVLKDRLSVYNRTADHEVVYYKGCKSYEDMGVVESMVLNKLKEYREKANRDRFVLPVDKDINFFIDVINKAIDF